MKRNVYTDGWKNAWNDAKTMFTTVNGKKVTEIFDLPATTQKSYYGKAKVIVTQEGKYLLSYNTIVCGVLSNGCFVKFWDDWSSTTAKHINDFMRFVRFGNGFKKKEWNKLECFKSYSDFNKNV